MVVAALVYWAGSRSCRCDTGGWMDVVDSLEVRNMELLVRIGADSVEYARVKGAFMEELARREAVTREVIKWLPYVEKEYHDAGFDAQCERMLRAVE